MDDFKHCNTCNSILRFEKLGHNNFYYCPNTKCSRYGITAFGKHAGMVIKKVIKEA